MTQKDIEILGKRYCFLGVSDTAFTAIAEQVERLNSNENFEEWKQWLHKVTGDKIMVVYDPYGTFEEISSDLPQKATDAAEALINHLGGDAKKHKNAWNTHIADMFKSYFCEGRIYGMQFNDGIFKTSDFGTLEALLFIDFTSLGKKKKELFLPTILHETTHFLEAKQLYNHCFGERGTLFDNAANNELWGVESAGSLGQIPEWQRIFRDMATYQGANPEERMATLIEKLAVGCLYENENTAWVINLRTVFRTILAEYNITL